MGHVEEIYSFTICMESAVSNNGKPHSPIENHSRLREWIGSKITIMIILLY